MNKRGCKISIVGYKHSEVPKYILGKENNQVVIRQVDYKPIKIV